ncbi:DUF305 domain-containing protein [Longimicrobium sp.]|uniref:DUF305 domain-containing protein n=1 Tax=Longimicrobium sp. TaxID=2029185 RepID=UPI002B78F42C|nr:DUF305 domain-containing protein [Longimicrobium sp.]HSU16120.1 DUF305 domain-containing protein [Longimicrobium sp.]
MTRPHTRSLAAAALLAAGMAAAMPAAAQEHHHDTPQAAPVARPDTARWTAADVHFMSSMIGHHAQAIVMSRLAPTHGASASVQTLAARIINAQQDEIATMQQWLRDRGQPVPDPAAPMHMEMGGMQHEMLMPGMLTDAQMAELEHATGSEFDRLFLTFMIQHHRGATQMVQQLFGSWGAGQDETVFKFASDVNVDQTTEIDRMQRMLASVVFGAPAP